MKPVVLCILDGWGHRTLDQANGLTHALQWQRISQQYPHTFLNASESFVGLPDGQMGNSEVGHMTIGLGRVLMQDLPRIDEAVRDHTFDTLQPLTDLIAKVKAGSNRCHVMGLFSDGGVHSSETHFIAACEVLIKAGIQVIVHPILDGRDTSPKAAENSLLLKWLDEQAVGHRIIRGTMGGRFYAMDRDNRWDRIQKAYDALMSGQGSRYATIEEALKTAYNQDKTDEFVEPVVFNDYQGVQTGDGFFFINFRSDRARQFMTALVDPDFTGFSRAPLNFSGVLGMTAYSAALAPYMATLFAKTPLSDGLGETVSKQGYHQLRLSETEKYAHVTYFFNGGVETPFPGEERLMIPSPNVETYDLQPEMSAPQVTEKLLAAMSAKTHQLIVVNYANPDMVGHTGVVSAIEKATQTIDGILAQLEKAALTKAYTLIITADHGNVETMVDENGAPHTAHTCNPVPFVVINGSPQTALTASGTLADIAPTILHILEIPIPAVMTGQCLVR